MNRQDMQGKIAPDHLQSREVLHERRAGGPAIPDVPLHEDGSRKRRNPIEG